MLDDIDIEAIGDEDQLHASLTGATKLVIIGLENKVRAEVSREKSVVLASSQPLRDRIAKTMKPCGVKVETSGKKLGTDFTLGNARRCATLKKSDQNVSSSIQTFTLKTSHTQKPVIEKNSTLGNR